MYISEVKLADQKSLNLHKKPALTVRQASDTHIEKPHHFKTAIAAKPEVVLIIRKHIRNYHFKFYILSFVHIVTKIISSELLAYKGSGGITRQKIPLKSFDKKNIKNKI